MFTTKYEIQPGITYMLLLNINVKITKLLSPEWEDSQEKRHGKHKNNVESQSKTKQKYQFLKKLVSFHAFNILTTFLYLINFHN